MSKRLKELQQKQHDLKAEATALLDAAEKDGRDLAAAEETRYQAIEAELSALAGQIAAEERTAERRRSLGAVRSAIPALDSVTNEPNPALTGGFRDMAEFARAVRLAYAPGGAQVDQRLFRAAPTNFHEGGGSAGEGFELPIQYRNDIWSLVLGMEGLINDVDMEPTSARQVDWVADESTPWGNTGIVAKWRAESTQMTASKMATKGRSVTLHELYAFVLATEELLADAPRLANRLTQKAAEAISWKVDDTIIYGTGSGQPLGWFTSGALVSIAKKSGQAADTIVPENVLGMYSRLLVAPGDRPYWLANRDVVPQLAMLQIGNMPAWTPPSSGLAVAPGGFLLGYPIRWSEHAKTLGDKGDVQLVSPKGYYAARRTEGARFASSIHLYFDYAIEAFRWTFRLAGQPHLSAPVSPANGAATKSYFVTLDERA